MAETRRAFGYPGRGTLTAWVREALPETRKAVVGRVGRRQYPETLKQAGVMELCARQESAQYMNYFHVVQDFIRTPQAEPICVPDQYAAPIQLDGACTFPEKRTDA